MKKTSKLIFLSLLALTVACATAHNGNYATAQNSPDGKLTPSKILVSGGENNSLSDKFFSNIDLTFENQSSKWVRVSKVTLDFGSAAANKGIAIPVGKDLQAWAESAQRRKAQEDYNTAMVLSSIAAMGTIASVGSADRNTRNLGRAGALAAGSALTVQATKGTLDNLQLAKLVPDSHLLSDGFVIPPGMNTKKWVTLFAEDPLKIPYVETVTINIHLENGKVESVTLPFRQNGFIKYSAWQMGHKDNPAEIRAREDQKHLGLARGTEASNNLGPSTSIGGGSQPATENNQGPSTSIKVQ